MYFNCENSFDFYHHTLTGEGCVFDIAAEKLGNGSSTM
jgi:hypothetical protein